MKSWKLPLAVSLAGTVLWWTHKIITNMFPPFDNLFDTALWMICSALKFATIICIPIALGRVFVHCHRNLSKTRLAMTYWGMGLLILLLALSLVRAPLTAALNDCQSKFFPATKLSPAQEFRYRDVDVPAQVAQWQSGATLLKEIALIAAVLLVLGLIGFCGGRLETKAGIVATVLVAVVLLAGSLSLKLLVVSYDDFFAGTVIAPVSRDVLVPFMAGDPTSEIGFLFYSVIIWVSWLLDTRVLSRPAVV